MTKKDEHFVSWPGFFAVCGVLAVLAGFLLPWSAAAGVLLLAGAGLTLGAAGVRVVRWRRSRRSHR